MDRDASADGSSVGEHQIPDDPDVLFRCTNCDWIGPAEDVDWGRWTPPGQETMRATPEKSDCPECGSEVEQGAV